MLRSIITSPKTSVVGFVAGIAGFLEAFHIYHLTSEQMNACVFILLLLMGLFGKDGDRGATSDKTDK